MNSDEASQGSLPFTAADLTAIAHWHPRFRASAMRLRVEHDHESYLDAVEIGEPWPSPDHLGIRWIAGRDTRGVWVDDTGATDGDATDHWATASTMDEGLGLIWQAADAERLDAIAAIPDLTDVVGLSRDDRTLASLLGQAGHPVRRALKAFRY